MPDLLARSDYAQVVDWRAVAGLCVIAGFVLAMAVLLAAIGVFDRWLYTGCHHANAPRDSTWVELNEQTRQAGELADARRGGEER